MNKQKNYQSPAPTKSGPRPLKLPSSWDELLDMKEKSSFSYFVLLCGCYAQFAISMKLMCALIRIFPSRSAYLIILWLFANNDLLIVGFYFYLGVVSHLLPSRQVGFYVKHGMELVALLAAVIWQLLWGYMAWDLIFFSAIIVNFHVLCHLFYNHPPDLSCSDWFLKELMQVAVYGCGSNRYAIVATTVACVMIIYYRFCTYSCPKDSSYLPISMDQVNDLSTPLIISSY